MEETLKEKRKISAVILSIYFVFFAALYFTNSDISPSTDYIWRYLLTFFCFGCGYIALRAWKKSWVFLWIPIFFLTLLEVAFTLSAMDAFFTNPANVDFLTFFAFNQDPRPFYALALKVRYIWFLIHLSALMVWVLGNPAWFINTQTRAPRMFRTSYFVGGMSAIVMLLIIIAGVETHQIRNQSKGMIQAQEEESAEIRTVSDAIANGKTCFKEVEDVWTCDYQVGNDLSFSITKNGLWTELVIHSEGQANSDYYLAKESLPSHPIGFNSYRLNEDTCLLIKAGKKSSPGDVDSKEIYSKGYISPKNGNSYKFLSDCTKTIAPQL